MKLKDQNLQKDNNTGKQKPSLQLKWNGNAGSWSFRFIFQVGGSASPPPPPPPPPPSRSAGRPLVLGPYPTGAEFRATASPSPSARRSRCSSRSLSLRGETPAPVAELRSASLSHWLPEKPELLPPAPSQTLYRRHSAVRPLV